MNQWIAMIMLWWGFLSNVMVLTTVLPWASANSEGDALTVFKHNLYDPNGVLENWNASLPNPCGWMHVACNNGNSVTRLDLGNANLSGKLVLELGQLANLQYLELFDNNIDGGIPNELGNLTHLVSMDLYHNNLSGHIPTSLGNLQRLRFLRLNNNNLTGEIPMSLTTINTLEVLNLSNNQLTGRIPTNGSFQLFNQNSFYNNSLDPIRESQPSFVPPTSQSPQDGSSIFGATAALLFLHLMAIFSWH